ncbi:FUSC family protein [Streptomyces sp.]|uniref:FUSC family protein n=1 Tax=Streptomyces sp. TaxID=1931 RepID=UPI002F3E6448
MSRKSYVLPAWLAHAVRWQRGPVPWGAVARGALGAGTLLAVAGALGRPTMGVIAALGAMLAGVNDRPGSRSSAVSRLGLPALAGACGMLIGTSVGGASPLLLVLALTAVALPAGALSAAGPVASIASTQLLITIMVGAGMPLPEPAWQRAVLYLAGGCWLVVLRVTMPSPGARLDFLDGERDAVAAAYDAVADLLLAAGGPRALDRRARLTAALDRAQDALGGPRWWRRPIAAERRIRSRFAAVLPLTEAATALTWAGDPLTDRAAEGARRLARAVRTDGPPGPLPAPVRDTPGLRALDDALLKAAEAFGTPRAAAAPGTTGRGSQRTTRKTAVPHLPQGALTVPRTALGDPPTGAHAPLDRPVAPSYPARPNPRTSAARRAFGRAGREYGVRVAASIGASAAVAQALHPGHWYWLPVTAVFLVKPDLGPLASRVINRALGTVAGVLLFAVMAAVVPGGVWPYPFAVVCAALVPVATRHFGVQTGVVTMLVLAFVTVGGDAGAYWDRLSDTLLACAIVLLVGHLPWPVRRGGDVAVRLSDATEAAERYVGHVLERSGDTDRRFALRRAAYRTLADARSAAELAAAELPPLARHSRGATGEITALERLVDAATAAAVHLDHGDGAARSELLRLAAHRGTCRSVTIPAPPRPATSASRPPRTDTHPVGSKRG